MAKPSVTKKKGKGKYHWGKVEQKRYVDFLLENLSFFELSANDRRMIGINSKMSKTIKTRDTNQCRSHHQKMLVKFETVERIIAEFQALLCPKNQKKWNQRNPIHRDLKVMEDRESSVNESICSF